MSDERKWNPDPYSSSGQPSRLPGQPTGNPSRSTGNHAPETQKQETGSSSGMAPRYAHYQMHQQAVYTAQNVPHKKESVGKKFALTVSLALVFGVVAGTVFQCVNLVSEKYFKTGTEEKQVSTAELTTAVTPAAAAAGTTETSSGGAGSVAEVASAAMPAVVAITSVSVQEIPNYFSLFGFNYGTQEYSSESSGSGIIVGENDDELLIATNNHVVSGATTLSVCFIGNDTSGNSGSDASGDTSGTENTGISDSSGTINMEDAVNAKIKGTDTTNDLAVVAVQKSDIPDDTLSRIKIAQIGNSDDLQVGEQVVAIGNALGYGQSVTSGWVSALNRSISTDDGTSSGLIQTDAAINPGNSGGALLNMNGEVIGINSAKYADSAVEGMGYAIPVSKAKPILEDLMNRQTRDKVDSSEAGYLEGIETADLSSKALEMYGMPAGVFVRWVQDGSACAAAGMQKGDIIVKFDGQSVTDATDLNNVMSYYAAGETVDVVVSRAIDGTYAEQTLSVTLGSTPGY